MATIKAILNKDKPQDKNKDRAQAKKKGKSASLKNVIASGDIIYPIYIRLHHQRRRKYVSVGRFVKESEWDPKLGLVKKTNPDYATINAIIRKEIKKLDGEVLRHLAMEETTDVISGIRKKEKKRVMNNFFLLAENYFEDLEKSEKYSRVSGDRPRINHMKAFHKSGQLRFEDIDPAFLRGFQIFLKSEYSCGERTVMNHLVTIRTLYNLAVQEGIADRNLYPFGKGKVLIRFPESLKIGLNVDEVHQIEEADFSSELHLQLAKDMWLFSFYLAGIRISDVLRIKWKDCIDHRLTYVMGKNGKVVSLKLPDKAVAILERYRPAEPDYEGYVFGRLSKEYESNPKIMYQKVVSATARTNEALVTIATRLKLKKKLSCHIARHTFGHITGDKISPQMLQKLYRHTDIKTTMGYQSNFIHNDVDDALESVLNF